MYRVTALGEWWRALTALTLHSDLAHALSNVVTGSLFCIPLCRRVGLGSGLLLTVLAGALGNAVTCLFRPPYYLSQGFSTAVFGAAGLLAAFMATHAFRHAMSGHSTPRIAKLLEQGLRMRSPLAKALRHALFQAMQPLGAGLAFLALLGGSDAPGVDYLAHSMGLAAGMVLGLLASGTAPRLFLPSYARSTLLQLCCLTGTAGLLAFAWHLELQNRL